MAFPLTVKTVGFDAIHHMHRSSNSFFFALKDTTPDKIGYPFAESCHKLIRKIILDESEYDYHTSKAETLESEEVLDQFFCEIYGKDWSWYKQMKCLYERCVQKMREGYIIYFKTIDNNNETILKIVNELHRTSDVFDILWEDD